MVSIPVDVVNYICEFAAGNDKFWYPFFSSKTEKIRWKVNPYCSKYIQLSRKFLNQIREIHLTFYNVKTAEEREIQSKIIVFNQTEVYMKKIYIEFDLDGDNSGRFMLRCMLNTINHNIKPHDSLYLNKTEYANIIFGRTPSIWIIEPAWMTIGYETY